MGSSAGRHAISFRHLVALAQLLEIDELDLFTLPDSTPRHDLIDLTRRAPLRVVLSTREHLLTKLKDWPPLNTLTAITRAGYFLTSQSCSTTRIPTTCLHACELDVSANRWSGAVCVYAKPHHRYAPPTTEAALTSREGDYGGQLRNSSWAARTS